MIATKEIELTEIFETNLPYKPYCSDVKGVLQIRPRATAKNKNYIQYNEPNTIRWLTYDCDYAGALDHIGQNQLPAPNLAAINKQNGKSHLFYGLETPVCVTENGREKPKKFLQAINFCLTEALQSDMGFNQFISKNPLKNELWEVYEIKPTLYDLNEFLEYFTLPNKIPHKAKITGVGRNITLFENSRRWAYRQVLGYRVTGNKEGFFKAVLEHCEKFNAENFPTPLNYAEVKSTAKSISKWTWTKYTARWTDEQFSQVQSKRGKSGGKSSGQKRLDKTFESRVMANLYSMVGMSQKDIAAILNTKQQNISLWLKD